MRIKYNINIEFILIFFICVLTNSCNLGLIEKTDKLLYKLKLPNETNLIFSNNIVETDEFNILSYNNMYQHDILNVNIIYIYI